MLALMSSLFPLKTSYLSLSPFLCVLLWLSQLAMTTLVEVATQARSL